jgi:hypothetical protein
VNATCSSWSLKAEREGISKQREGQQYARRFEGSLQSKMAAAVEELATERAEDDEKIRRERTEPDPSPCNQQIRTAEEVKIRND